MTTVAETTTILFVILRRRFNGFGTNKPWSPGIRSPSRPRGSGITTGDFAGPSWSAVRGLAAFPRTVMRLTRFVDFKTTGEKPPCCRVREWRTLCTDKCCLRTFSRLACVQTRACCLRLFWKIYTCTDRYNDPWITTFVFFFLKNNIVIYAKSSRESLAYCAEISDRHKQHDETVRCKNTKIKSASVSTPHRPVFGGCFPGGTLRE